MINFEEAKRQLKNINDNLQEIKALFNYDDINMLNNYSNKTRILNDINLNIEYLLELKSKIMGKEFQENFSEYMFYLSIILYDKYLKDKNILLDIYYSKVYEICADYLNYDNTKKTLIESINDYINTRNDYILNLLNKCVEV